MSVMSERIPRRDWLLYRGVDQSWAWLCLGDPHDGSRPQPIDVSSWSGRLELLLPDDTSVYVQAANRMTSDGLVWFDIPASAFRDQVWAGRPTGSYKVTATDADGRTILLGEGQWTLN